VTKDFRCDLRHGQNGNGLNLGFTFKGAKSHKTSWRCDNRRSGNWRISGGLDYVLGTSYDSARREYG